ncbi:MAG TPA: HAMP domain-containing sensor histidine kinase [Cyclobacteriaceae bacterium]|nr:HAMP domain-containing sensor histidine kinase [Cyclobacteriaceae bacterium]
MIGEVWAGIINSGVGSEMPFAERRSLQVFNGTSFFTVPIPPVMSYLFANGEIIAWPFLSACAFSGSLVIVILLNRQRCYRSARFLHFLSAAWAIAFHVFYFGRGTHIELAFVTLFIGAFTFSYNSKETVLYSALAMAGYIGCILIERSAVTTEVALPVIIIECAVVFAVAFIALWMFHSLNERHEYIIREKNKLLFSQREEIINQAAHLKQQNKKLLELNAEKDWLMSIVAHDLRSPIIRMKGLANLLEVQFFEAEERVEVVKKIKQTSEEGLQLISEILEVNSAEYDRASLELTTFKIRPFIKDLVNRQKQQADAKRIQIYSEAEEDPTVTADARLLKRILENLISNAIKYSKPGTSVWIKAGRTNGAIVFSVRDEGPGISVEDQQKMFSRFQRLSARPTGNESSTGLGLAIVKSLAEKLQGEVIVNSAPGQGSEFIIRLKPIA